MKRVALLLFLAGWLVPLASAQDHFQVGAYADYFRLSQTNTNMAGIGGRVGYKAFSHVMLEGEMSYDFDQAFADHCVSPGCTVTVANSSLKVLHGLFGPKIVAGHGAIRPFFTAGSAASYFRNVYGLREQPARKQRQWRDLPGRGSGRTSRAGWSAS
jgi:hypothetical protein